jgi:hypothetical protein
MSAAAASTGFLSATTGTGVFDNPFITGGMVLLLAGGLLAYLRSLFVISLRIWSKRLSLLLKYKNKRNHFHGSIGSQPNLLTLFFQVKTTPWGFVRSVLGQTLVIGDNKTSKLYIEFLPSWPTSRVQVFTVWYKRHLVWVVRGNKPQQEATIQNPFVQRREPTGVLVLSVLGRQKAVMDTSFKKLWTTV